MHKAFLVLMFFCGVLHAEVIKFDCTPEAGDNKLGISEILLTTTAEDLWAGMVVHYPDGSKPQFEMIHEREKGTGWRRPHTFSPKDRKEIGLYIYIECGKENADCGATVYGTPDLDSPGPVREIPFGFFDCN
ncbi:hypothetical protein K2X33_04355 [bacterium]|nr:hypothetical protein [bacterium]